MTEFGELHPDGSVTNARTIKQADLTKCPHFILMPDHYRDDGSCRCDDPAHTDMQEWGYTWDGTVGRWV